MGENGVGKTSIPLIIEEVLFSKNSKGIKKQSLPNRNLSKPTLSAELVFIKENDEYKVVLTRKTTAKVSLYKNGEDISSHTATNTYKSIQAIIGMDFKTFSQLIYQSSNSNLEFLTSTDTNRKKFLIGLFNLDKYVKIHNHFNSVLLSITSKLDSIEGKVGTYEAWINKHKAEDLTPKPIEEIPSISEEEIDELSELKAKVSNISKENASINKNNQLKEMLSNLDTSILSESIEAPVDKQDIIKEGTSAKNKKLEAETLLKAHNTKLIKLNNLSGTCPSCMQEISEDIRNTMIDEIKKDVVKLKDSIEEAALVIDNCREKLNYIKGIEDKIRKKEKVEGDLISLRNQIDDSIPTEALDPGELSDKIFELQTKINNTQNHVARVINNNKKAEAHNSKVKVILQQLEEYSNELDTLKNECGELSDLKTKLTIIKKAFSTNGLVSYKVEYLVKDLEQQINEYLAELSGGRFQILFVLKGEKLNIDIIDNGVNITIEELSAGELARINASTLLAIRKLMAAISSSKINILFLDEVMGVLDKNGKEGLIDVLHKETELNTLLVSHEYSHPLIPKMTIEKINEVSVLSE